MRALLALSLIGVAIASLGCATRETNAPKARGGISTWMGAGPQRADAAPPEMAPSGRARDAGTE